MQLIRQSVKRIGSGNLSLTKQIELAARSCYKSEDKIKDGSDLKITKNMVNLGHHAMIEFATMVLQIPDELYASMVTNDPEHLKYLNFSNSPDTNRCIVSGNARAFRNYIENNSETCEAAGKLYTYLMQTSPVLFQIKDLLPTESTEGISEVTQKDLMFGEEFLKHTYIHFFFVTNRGVTHEMVRHRPSSFAQESTRYVTYEGNTEFIFPVWWDTLTEEQQQMFIDSCETSEILYKKQLESGLKAQQAREVLPNSLKTEIHMKSNLEHWGHVFKLRCSPKAHPQIQALMIEAEQMVIDEFGSNCLS